MGDHVLGRLANAAFGTDELAMNMQPATVEYRDGIHAEWHFANGYGASVAKGRTTYGIELAVLIRMPDRTWKVFYGSPITGDVVGWIPDRATLATILTDIRALTNAEVGRSIAARWQAEGCTCYHPYIAGSRHDAGCDTQR